jgi:hypothetical protein
MPDVGLRHGDVVEVKSAAEILSTLDEEGALDGLPFMPELAQYCGHCFVVDKRADKVCDTVHYTGSRRLPDAVLLVELRCDGSRHDGCQAECRPFWKEAWLRRVETATAPLSPRPPDEQATAALLQLTRRSTTGRRPRSVTAARPPTSPVPPSTSSSGIPAPTFASARTATSR